MIENDQKTHWHLDKRVPVTIIVALILQTLAFVYLGTTWKNSIDHRIEVLEKDGATRAALELRLDVIRASQADRLTALETKFDFIQQSLQRIERATAPSPRP